MNINLQGAGNSFMGSRSLLFGSGLKSTQEKLERQAKCNQQVAFLEKQKENLKNMECDSLEDITKKLELFHSYEDQIAAAKAAYNNEQMWHIMDEAREQGEKIAKQAEKMEPKTPEERKEELVEEALGTDESKGALSEMLEEAAELAKELTEEVTELAKELTEEAAEMASEELVEETSEMASEELVEETSEMASEELMEETSEMASEELMEETSEMASEELVEETSEMPSGKPAKAVPGEAEEQLKEAAANQRAGQAEISANQSDTFSEAQKLQEGKAQQNHLYRGIDIRI